MTKRCPNCGETKSRSGFHRHRNRLDGLQSWCKSCFGVREKTPKARARRQEIHKRRMDEEPDYAERIKRQTREGWIRYQNTPHGSAKRREYWLSDAAKRSANKYRQSEKGKISNSVRHERRRASFEGNITTEEWTEIIGIYTDDRGTMCAYCCEIVEFSTMDHIEPLSKGGKHSVENVVPACSFCNSSKGAKPLLRWMYDKSVAIV